jgi:formate dehydrogenase subunit delta
MTAEPVEIRLGNDIARQFAHLPRDRAVAGIAEHLRRFWDPRMRANLCGLLPASTDADPLLVAAAEAV